MRLINRLPRQRRDDGGVRAALRVQRLDDRDVPTVLWVTTTADSGSGSLRDTLAAASNGDTIQFSLPSGKDTIGLTSGSLPVGIQVTIDGGAPNAITITRDTGAPGGAAADSILTVPYGSDLTLIGVRITGGVVYGWQGYGGGIYNASTGVLTVEDSVIENNSTFSVETPVSAATSAGGGVYNEGEATFTRTRFDHNDAYTPPVGLTTGDGAKVYGGGVWNAGTLTIRDSTISDNLVGATPPDLPDGTVSYDAYNSAYGGAVYNTDTGLVTVDRCELTWNRAELPGAVGATGQGGAFYNAGEMTVSRSWLDHNSARSFLSTGAVMYGGGFYNSGTLSIGDSALSFNQVSGGDQKGGGVYNVGDVTIENSTLSANAAANNVVTQPSAGFGGGIANVGGTVEIRFSTLTLNRALSVVTTGTGTSTTSTGGGLWGDGFTLDSTIVAENTAGYIDSFPFTPVPTSGFDVDGTVTSLGYNLIGIVDLSSGWVTADLTGTAGTPLGPVLGPLQDNGGPTLGPTWLTGTAAPTHAVLPYSPAIAAGNPSTEPAADQRGVTRSTTAPNIGAYEGVDDSGGGEGGGDEGGGGIGGGGEGGPSGFSIAPPWLVSKWSDDIGERYDVIDVG